MKGIKNIVQDLSFTMSKTMTIDYQTLKFSELNIHRRILCVRFVPKVQFNEDRQCHKYLTKQQSFNRTTHLVNNVARKFT